MVYLLRPSQRLSRQIFLYHILNTPLPHSAPMSTSPSSPSSSPPRQHHVVSSFLCTQQSPADPNFRISVFKRSSSVRVYQNLWAACSGSIDSTDASPQEAALREINEETGLNREQLRLLREGESYEIYDKALGKRWQISAFAWLLVRNGVDGGEGISEDEAKKMIKLDWEHTEVRFVRPEEVDRMETVEHLGKSVRSVLGGL